MELGNIHTKNCYIGMEISQQMIEFVHGHANDDIATLRLKYTGKKLPEDFSLDFALVQIEARRKTRKKLPTFLQNPAFMFPSLIAAEQASNEAVARFHATLVASGASLLDLTAGLGIDDMSMANAGVNVVACELDQLKCDVLRHNFSLWKITAHKMGYPNVICTDSIEYLKDSPTRFDAIFADPARRASDGMRVHALADCMPDILGNMSLIMSHTDRLIVKCSPLLDMTLIIKTVENLHHIYVVCFRGECKEVLMDIRKDSAFTGVTCIDLDWDKVISEFHVGQNYLSVSSQSLKYAALPSPAGYRYLYEPNAAVMKTGAWAALQAFYPELQKADASTHLFLSDTLYEGFPGRVLEITAEPDKKALKRLKGNRVNVVARNHPMSAPQIIAKYGIIPGGDTYLYAFRYQSTPTLLSCKPAVK